MPSTSFSSPASRSWSEFAAQLSAINTFEETRDFLRNVPTPNGQVWKYYVHLIMLVHAKAVPPYMTHEEKELYVELVRRWKINSQGGISPKTFARLEKGLDANC